METPVAHTRRGLRGRRALAVGSASVALAGLIIQAAATPAGATSPALVPGNLIVSTSVYQNSPSNIVVGSTILPGCTVSATVPSCAAIADGTYPYVFNNDTPDPSFGVTTPITLDQLTPSGNLVSQIPVPNSSQSGVTPSSDQMVTSFSSKSELGLNLSTDGQYLTFMGYNAPADQLDVSNSNTPGDTDATNPVAGSDYRVAAQLGADGTFHFTETNAYSGNNGRAAILNNSGGANLFYTVGNAGNGSNPEPQAVVQGVGSQIFAPANAPESSQTPGQPTALGNFNITQLGQKADKSAKDDNFRGIAFNNNVLYFTKGSGSNGVDTVYFVDTSGTACPSGGIGVPATGAAAPASSTVSYSTSNATLGLTTSNPGLAPTTACILKGFPTTLAKGSPTNFPFGLWFANPTTLYVADEGNGTNTYSTSTSTYSAAAASTTAGLEKWVFSGGQWNLAYTLQTGLNLGTPYSVSGYPTGINSATGLPWAPATDGLRNLTGKVNADGSVTITAATSTVSGSGDQGTDPNQLVQINDQVGATSLPSGESFHTLMAPANATVVRGVSYTPGTGTGTTPTATTVSGPSSPGTGTPVTYTATVSPTVTGGTVNFTDSAGQVSGCDAVPVDASGQATCQVTFSNQVGERVTATYSGTSTYASSSGTFDLNGGPPPSTPEVPNVLLLPLAALAIGGAGALVMRRRRGGATV